MTLIKITIRLFKQETQRLELKYAKILKMLFEIALAHCAWRKKESILEI